MEQVVIAADQENVVIAAVEAVVPETVVPDTTATPIAASEGVVARESGTGDLAGPDGAAVADIAATVQPLMDTRKSVVKCTHDFRLSAVRVQ